MPRRKEIGETYWVIGVINAYGDIRVRTNNFGDRDSPMHTDAERVSGRPFRWNCFTQEFHDVLARSERLSPDDYMAVRDWLEREGYKDVDQD